MNKAIKWLVVVGVIAAVAGGISWVMKRRYDAVMEEIEDFDESYFGDEDEEDG